MGHVRPPPEVDMTPPQIKLVVVDSLSTVQVFLTVLVQVLVEKRLKLGFEPVTLLL